MDYLLHSPIESRERGSAMCFNCHYIGHYKNECPRMSMNKKYYFDCKKPWHIKNQFKNVVCYRCGERGHIQMNCKK